MSTLTERERSRPETAIAVADRESPQVTYTSEVPRPEAAPLPHGNRTRTPEVVDSRYATLRDKQLVATLIAEDLAESEGLDPLERLTCRTHRRWVYQCISSDAHVFVVTGHRWCRSCECAADVAVDELTWSVSVTCPSCGDTPAGQASRQIVRTCRASMAAARGHG